MSDAGWVEGTPAGDAAIEGPSPGVRTTLDEMTVRMDKVVEAAERAALVIRRDAEERARAHLAEAQREADRLTAERVRLIADLTDDLIERANEVRRRSDGMIAALDDAIDAAAGSGPSDRPAPSAEFPPEAVSYAQGLAASGYGREAIAGALAQYFGMDEPGPLLDRLAGPGQPSSTSREAIR